VANKNEGKYREQHNTTHSISILTLTITNHNDKQSLFFLPKWSEIIVTVVGVVGSVEGGTAHHIAYSTVQYSTVVDIVGRFCVSRPHPPIYRTFHHHTPNKMKWHSWCESEGRLGLAIMTVCYIPRIVSVVFHCPPRNGSTGANNPTQIKMPWPIHNLNERSRQLTFFVNTFCFTLLPIQLL